MISINNLTSGIVSTATSFNTAAITPAANKLIVTTVANIVGSGTANIPTLSGCGLTYNQTVTQLDAGNLRRLTIFHSMSSAAALGTISGTFAGQTESQIYWSIEQFTNAEPGNNGSNAIPQSAGTTLSATGTAGTVTLTSFQNVNNATYGAIRNNTGTPITVGAGFTQIASVNNSFYSEFKNTNDTTVDFSWPSANSITIAAAIEVKNDTTAGLLTDII